MPEEIHFEESLKKLEKIVQSLEEGEMPLDESLKKYEEGIKIAQGLSKRLEQAQRRVEMLMKTGSGSFEAVPFGDAQADAEEKGKPKAKRSSKGKKGEDLLI